MALVARPLLALRQVRHLRREHYRTTVWKNGGGTTEEIAAAGDGGWRLSLATIEADGPFSDFSGFDRTLVVVEGKDLLLRIDGKERQAMYCEPCRFRGESRVYCAPRSGLVRVLNVMTRRAQYDHAVFSEAPVELAHAIRTFRFAVHGPDRFDTFEGGSGSGSLSIAIVHPPGPPLR